MRKRINKPIINGTGNYYIEAQTRDQTRTDVIVDYLRQQYIIELKIWRGERYNVEGEKQIIGYLDYWNLNIGYMLSFNFNKKTGVYPVQIGDKLLFEGTIYPFNYSESRPINNHRTKEPNI